MKKPVIAVVLGTRPEIIKVSPILSELKRRRTKYVLIHTGQHYSLVMDRIFFTDLHMQEPDFLLGVGSGTHGEQTGKILMRIEKVLIKIKPNIVLVEGDTNSVLAAALAATKLRIQVGHIEAGLRSFYREMPEEINRILTDHISDYLFAPTHISKENLLNEGIDARKIYITGNTIVDAIIRNRRRAQRKSKILTKVAIAGDHFMLLTLRRAENLENKQRLKEILSAVIELCKEYLIIFPVHPRTKNRLKDFKLLKNLKSTKKLRLLEPLGYLDFLKLQSNAQLILTDSGGIQEESCILNIPCVTLRDNTERPETIAIGSNILGGCKRQTIMHAVKIMLKKRRKWKQPFGNGTSAEKIVAILTKT